MAGNTNLSAAKTAKNDEFYTQYSDIEAEMNAYVEYNPDVFRGKTVLLPCDDPEWSNFTKYFAANFERFGLKKLISTSYAKSAGSQQLTQFEAESPMFDESKNATHGKLFILTRDKNKSGQIDTDDIEFSRYLDGDGDFRSEEVTKLRDEADVIITNPPFSCYSSDTEVMTDHGWKLIKDVDINFDQIMSLNPVTNAMELVKAVDFISSPVNGELYRYHNQNMDFCVTGNHRMLAYHRTGGRKDKAATKAVPFVNAADLKPSMMLPISGFDWHGRQEDCFVLPGTTQTEQYSRREIEVPDRPIPIDDWLEFFGFYLADGCYRDHINTCGMRDYSVSIKQSTLNETYVLDLIKRIGFHASISRDGTTANYNIYSKQLWEHLSQFGRSADMYIPRELLNLSKEHLAFLLKGYMNGDSYTTADGQIHFSSVSKRLIENVQELLLKVHGLVTQVRQRTTKHSYDNGTVTLYYINVSLERHTQFSKYGKPEMVPYNDNVYCLTLERNHVMLVRHNGIIGWSGNCFREFLAWILEADKQFIIIGNKNAITYKEVFPLIKDNKMWLGYSQPKEFDTPNGMTKKVNGLTRWFTNVDLYKRHQSLLLDTMEHNLKFNKKLKKKFEKDYGKLEYPHYDNYDAIEVPFADAIPSDYDGAMGVPITFMDKYNPEQFEIIGLLQSSTDEQAGIPNLRYYDNFKEMRQDMSYTGASGKKANGNPVIAGKSAKGNFLYCESTNEYVHSVYARIVIRPKKGDK